MSNTTTALSADDGLTVNTSTWSGQQQAPVPMPPQLGNPNLLTPTSGALTEALQANWQKVDRANLGARLGGNLMRLAIVPAGGLGAGSRALSPASLSEFLDFWIRIRGVAVEPELALAPDGTLAAEWFKSRQQRLDVRFTGDKAVYGLIARNTISEGAETLDALVPFLRNHPAQPLRWNPA